MELKPSQFTSTEFETLVDRLMGGMSDKFSFDTNKRGKMRDVVAGQLFGATNGFKSVKEQFKSEIEKIAKTFPLPRFDFDLPDTIYLFTNNETDMLEVYFKASLGRGGKLGKLRFNLWEDQTNLNIIPDVYEPAVYEKVAGQRGHQIDSSRSELYRYIVQNFHVVSAEIDTGSIENWGAPANTRIEEMIEFAEDMWLDAEPLKTTSMTSHLSVYDRGDDSGEEILLKLERKSAHSISPILHSGFCNTSNRSIDIIMTEPLASAYYEVSSVCQNIYGLVEISDLVEPENEKLDEISIPLSVNGKIIGYARHAEAKEDFMLMYNHLLSFNA